MFAGDAFRAVLYRCDELFEGCVDLLLWLVCMTIPLLKLINHRTPNQDKKSVVVLTTSRADESPFSVGFSIILDNF